MSAYLVVNLEVLISGLDPDPAPDLHGTAEIDEVVIGTGEAETEAGIATGRKP